MKETTKAKQCFEFALRDRYRNLRSHGRVFRRSTFGCVRTRRRLIVRWRLFNCFSICPRRTSTSGSPLRAKSDSMRRSSPFAAWSTCSRTGSLLTVGWLHSMPGRIKIPSRPEYHRNQAIQQSRERALRLSGAPPRKTQPANPGDSVHRGTRSSRARGAAGGDGQ